MTRIEHSKLLRASQERHYNCAQAVVLPFADKIGLSEAQACDLAEHFGSGMRHGGTCGAVSGAMMVLGLIGAPNEKTVEFLRKFRSQDYQQLECAVLLKQAHEAGVERKCHCDGLIERSIAILEEII